MASESFVNFLSNVALTQNVIGMVFWEAVKMLDEFTTTFAPARKKLLEKQTTFQNQMVL